MKNKDIYFISGHLDNKGDFRLKKDKETEIESFDSIINFVKDFPLGPSCFINELYYERINCEPLGN